MSVAQRLIRNIFGKVRDINKKYDLIVDGDRVAVGMSGGKDSNTLLYFLDLLRNTCKALCVDYCHDAA